MTIILHLDQLTGRLGVAVLSREIHAWLKAEQGRTISALATKAGLSDGTVARIYYRETYEPRFYTICMLLKAVGFVAARFDKAEDFRHALARVSSVMADDAGVSKHAPERVNRRPSSAPPPDAVRGPARISGTPDPRHH